MSAKVVEKLTRNWNPAGPGGLVAWYNADALPGVQDGDAVATWYDFSESEYHLTQSVAANQPTFVRNATAQRRSVVRFARPSSGNCDFLRNNALGAAFAGEDVPITILMAFKPTNLTLIEPLTFLNAAGSRYISLYTTGPTFFWEKLDATGRMFVGTTALAQWQVHAVTFGTDTMTAYYYGGPGQSDTDPSGMADFDRFFLGTFDGGAGTNFFYEGDIGEVLVYSSVLSTADLNRAGGWLAGRWDAAWTVVT